MKNNRLLIALVVLIGVGALAMNAARSHQSSTTVEAPSEDLPKIKKEDVNGLEIIKPNKETYTFAKKEGGWELTAPLSAKADTSAVDAILDKLADLEITGVAATRKENHARLQVDADKAIRVKASGGGKTLLDLYVGTTKGGSTIVRSEGKDAALTARGSFRYLFDKELKLFRDRVVTDFDSAELTAIELESAKGKFKFAKPETTWKQADGEKPINDFADSKVQSLASSLTRLRATDFAAANIDANAAGLSAPLAKATLTRKNAGPVVIELGAAVDGDHYLRVSDKPTIYRVSKFTGERLIADATAFVADKKDENAAVPDAPGGMPPGMMGGPGGGQIPPELLQQLQQQMANQH